MGIWHGKPDLESVNFLHQGVTIVGALGIKITRVGDDYLEGTMPVDSRTHQPMGILHGGASVVLAETLGSMAANMVVDSSKYYCVGLDVNANHLRSVRSGVVTGRATAVHLGRSTQVWSIGIVDANNRDICISRLTMSVLSYSAG